MRIGVFGGTFDPIHLGHLILAEQCREQAQLDQVWFIPAARPPHKPDRSLSAFHRRLEMLALAVAGQPAFVLNDLEKDRPGPSYTVETLHELHLRHPDVDWHLLLGADCLPDLPLWREPGRITEQACLVIAARPGWTVWSAEQLRGALQLAPQARLRQQIVQVPLIEISSSDIRQRAASGRSVRYLVPRAVECYIETHRLYQTTASV